MQAEYKCDVLSDLVPLVQFKKREKHPWRSVDFSNVAGFYPATFLKVILVRGKVTLLHGTNGTKSRNVSQIIFLTRVH